MTDAFVGQSGAPLVLFYLEGMSEIKGQMLEFNAKKSSDKKMD